MDRDLQFRRVGAGRNVVRAVAVMALVIVGLGVASAVGAAGAPVTRGDIRAFASGAGLDISGRAQMVRTADGRTIVTVHVDGLLADTAYGSHVHQLPCGSAEADGHYKFDPAGPAAPPNEIWPAFTTNAAGSGSGFASVQGTAGPNAVSVVIHAPGGAKIACADLH
jgi:hypothetical protein